MGPKFVAPAESLWQAAVDFIYWSPSHQPMVRKYTMRHCLFCLLFAIAPALADSEPEPDLIYLTTPAGQSLFMESELHGDYFPLASYLESEQVLTFCGPASMAAVLNSLGIPRPSPHRLFPYQLFTQDLVFNPANQALKSYARVEHEGLVLAEVGEFLENLGVQASTYHASEFSVDWLRETLVNALASPGQRLIANYSRRPLGQDGDGHLSPLAAYDRDSDRVLILDVAKYKYPPVWLTVAQLHEAMLLEDPGSNLSRGLVVVSP